MGRTSDRHGRLEPLIFFLVSALILVARVAYHPLPNWTNYKLGQLSLGISISPSPSSTFSFHVDPTVQQVVVTALPATSTASMSVNGQLVMAGRPSNPIPILVGGVTHLTIALASPSGAATPFYTLTLLQPVSPAPSPSLLPPQPLSVGNDFQPTYFPAATPSPVPLTPTSTTAPSTSLSPPPPAARLPILPASSLVGVAYDGYLANCVLYADANLNGVQDASETGTTSGPLGQFVLGGYTGGPIVLNPQDPVNSGAQNCTDVNTGVQLVGAISAPPSSTSVSPLSFILWQVMTLLPDLLQSEVNRIVTASLQINGTDLATCDPIAMIAGGEVGGAALARATLVRLAQVQSAVTLGAAFLGGRGAFGSAAVSQALAQALLQTFHPLAPPSARVATSGRRKLWRQWKAEGGPRMVQFEAGGNSGGVAQQGLTVDLTDPTHIYSVLAQSATLFIHTAGPAALTEGTQAIALINTELDSLLHQTLTGNQFLTAVFATSAVAQGLWVNRIQGSSPATSSSFTSLSKAQFLEDLACTLETNPAVAALGSRAATAPPTAPSRAPVPTLVPPPAPSTHSGGATGWWASSLWLKVALCAAVGVAAFLLLFIFCTRCLPCCCSCCYREQGRRSKPPLPPSSAPGPRAALHWHLDCLGLPGGSTPSSPSSCGNPGQHWGGSRVSEIEVTEASHLGRRVPFFGFGPPLPTSDDQVALVPSGSPTPAQHSSAISLCSSTSTAPSAVGEDGNPSPPAPPLSQALLQQLGLRGGRLSPWEEGEGNSGAFSHRAEVDPEEAEQSLSSEAQSDTHWVMEVEQEQEQAIIAVPVLPPPPTAVMAPRSAERILEGAGGRGEEGPSLLHGRSRLGLPTSVTEEGAEEAAEITDGRRGAEEEKETGEVEEAHGPGWEAAYVAGRLELLKSGASRLRRERFGGDQILRPGTWEPLEMDTQHRSGGEGGGGDTAGHAPVDEES